MAPTQNPVVCRFYWVNPPQTKDRPKPVYTFSAENETGAENVILFSAKTETQTKLVNHFRLKTKVIIFVDYSVILRQHQQYSTISCSTFIAMSSLQRVQALNCSTITEYRPSEFRCFRSPFPPKTKTQHHFRPKTKVTETIKN